MTKQINMKLVVPILASLAGRIVILVLVVLLLSHYDIRLPLWLIFATVLIISAMAFVTYRISKRNPLLGFENVIGKSGLTVGQVAGKGTVRIDRQLWHAETEDENIEEDVEIVVVAQTGLKLTVKRKSMT